MPTKWTNKRKKNSHSIHGVFGRYVVPTMATKFNAKLKIQYSKVSLQHSLLDKWLPNTKSVSVGCFQILCKLSIQSANRRYLFFCVQIYTQVVHLIWCSLRKAMLCRFNFHLRKWRNQRVKEKGEGEKERERDGENETQHAKVFHIICMEDELESVFILP